MTFAGRTWWAASSYANFLIAYSLGAGLLPEPTGPGPSCLSTWSPVHSRRAQPVGGLEAGSQPCGCCSFPFPPPSFNLGWASCSGESPVSTEVRLAFLSSLALKWKQNESKNTGICIPVWPLGHILTFLEWSKWLTVGFVMKVVHNRLCIEYPWKIKCTSIDHSDL